MINDPLLQALGFLGQWHGRPVNLAGAVQGLPTKNGLLTPELFDRAAQRCSFTSRVVKKSLRQLHQATLPAILLLEDDDCVVILGVKKGMAEISVSGAGGGKENIRLKDLAKTYTGYAILVKPIYDFESRSDFTPPPPKRSWFWGTLFRFRGFYARVAFATVIINVLALSSSLFIMNVYDRVVPNQAIDTLWALAAGAIGAFIIEFALRTLRTYFVDRAGHRIDLVLGGDLFAKVLGMQFAAKPASSGALAGQARSYEGLREFFASATIAALCDLPFVFVFAGIVYILGGPVAIPLIAGGVLALLFGVIMQFPISRAVGQSYLAGNQRQALFVESINALETVKATGSESELQSRMEEAVHVCAKADGKSRSFSQLALNVTMFLQQLVSTGIVIVAFFQVSAEAMSMGAMIACVILAGRAMSPLTMIASLLTRLQQSRRALQGLNQIMRAPSEREERGAQYISLDEFRPEVATSDLQFGYDSENGGTILNDLNIHVKPGERVAILGKIGSGKSTLLRLMMGLYHPDSGRMDISGIDTRQLDPAELRQNLGYVPQDPTPLFGTLRSNLKSGCPWASDAQIWKAAELAGLADYIRSLPRGVDHPVAEGGQSLSGGQRQALSIARAFLRNPQLLVFDEPTSAMDNSSEQQLLANLETYLDEDPNRTLIVATHRRSILSIIDRVIVLENGKAVIDGPKDQVMANPRTSSPKPIKIERTNPKPDEEVALRAEHSPQLDSQFETVEPVFDDGVPVAFHPSTRTR